MTDQTPQLTLYNSLTRKREVFTPQDPKRVTMYNCGPTVYSYAHIGNARAAVIADVLFRILRHIYGKDHVVYARNITDVDDRIIAAAAQQGVPISNITEKYARIYNEDLAAIGCLPPTVQPKATEHIDGMIELISTLLKDGYAYESEGHVFFEVSKYAEYGQLSGNTLDALRGGNRVGEGEVARKKNSADFVLWKPPLDGVGWEAPFGIGRPGWHIECSAMAKATLDETIDIHCGGVDLKFPHHENEIAQSNCAHGKPMAKYWVHNEFLNMGKDKMSKSLGNVKLVHDLLKGWDGEVIRLALLKAHYRSELIWSDDLLKESKKNLDSWYRSILKSRNHKPIPTGGVIFQRKLKASMPERLVEMLAHDLDIIEAIVELNHMHDDLEMMLTSFEHEFNEEGEPYPEHMKRASSDLGDMINDFLCEANLLGLLQKDPEAWFKGGMDTDSCDQLVKEYDAVRTKAVVAKAAGDKAAMGEAFARSDAIRDELKAQGIVIETGPDGSSWRKA